MPRRAPREEFVDQRLRLLPTTREALFGRGRRPRSLEREEPSDELERVVGPHRVGRERLEEVTPRVRPTATLDDVACLIEVVEDRVRVGDELAGEAAQQLVDGCGIVLRRVAEEHVLLGRHHHEEVSATALLDVLHQHARRVGAEVRRVGARVVPHRDDERSRQLRDALVPAADGAAVHVVALAAVAALHSVQRLMVLPASYDGVGQHAGACDATRDGQLERGGLQHRRGLTYLKCVHLLLRDVLATHRAHHDDGGRALLDDFTGVLADAVECVEPLALHVLRQHLDDDARQLLGQRLTARRLRALVSLHRRRGQRGGRVVGARSHQRRDDVHRQLLRRGEMSLALLPDEAGLELPHLLEHRDVQPLVLVALGLGVLARGLRHGLVGDGARPVDLGLAARTLELGNALMQVAVGRCGHGPSVSHSSRQCKRGTRFFSSRVTPVSNCESAAASMRTDVVPDAPSGTTKSARCSRFVSRQKPVLSHHSTFTRVGRFPTKT